MLASYYASGFRWPFKYPPYDAKSPMHRVYYEATDDPDANSALSELTWHLHPPGRFVLWQDPLFDFTFFQHGHVGARRERTKGGTIADPLVTVQQT